jgi:hypothetical protein
MTRVHFTHWDGFTTEAARPEFYSRLLSGCGHSVSPRGSLGSEACPTVCRTAPKLATRSVLEGSASVGELLRCAPGRTPRSDRAQSRCPSGKAPVRRPFAPAGRRPPWRLPERGARRPGRCTRPPASAGGAAFTLRQPGGQGKPPAFAGRRVCSTELSGGQRSLEAELPPSGRAYEVLL